MDKLQISTLTLTKNKIHYYKNTDNLSKYKQDIITGQYQGGFKLWQCTIDMLKYMEEKQNIFLNQIVMEIGCGHGLLGIQALKLGAAKVVFQDYNESVIQNLTKLNVKINGQNIEKNEFCFGDWNVMKNNGQKYDIIIGSELIYNQQNYKKIINCIKQFMKENGCCLLINKVYYFGVGGNIAGFKQQLDKSGLKYFSELKIQPNMGGNKKQIIKITY